MSNDHFANAIDWINRSTDKEEKADAGSVVAWQDGVRHTHALRQ
jgi:hypothetical protein